MSRPQNKPRHLALPGATAWELWEFEGENDAILKGSAESIATLNLPAGSTVCVPSGELCCYAVWLATGDGGLLEEMANLQLEARGLPVKGKTDAATALKRLGTTEGRTLCLTVCHPHASQSLKDVDYVAACTASFEAIPFEDNAVTLWRELGILNAAVCFGGKIVAVQRMSVGMIGKSVASEIICLLTELHMEGVTGPITTVSIREEAGGPAGDFNMPVTRSGRPLPVWPHSGVDLLPSRFQMEKKARQKRRKILKAGTMLAAACAALMALLALNVQWLSVERAALENGNRPLRPQVQSMRDTSLRWEALSPAFDADRSALELLYQVVRCLPPSDVQLTLFELKNGDLAVEGDSENVARIAAFESEIAKARELHDFSWKMPPPSILPNNTAHFQIAAAHR